jgi:hypothetical protein
MKTYFVSAKFENRDLLSQTALIRAKNIQSAQQIFLSELGSHDMILDKIVDVSEATLPLRSCVVSGTVILVEK